MALIKKSKLNPGTAPVATIDPVVGRPPARSAPSNGAARRVSVRSQDKLSERLAAATEELASGLTEASAAAEELRRSMEQIASGASEAAGAAQEQSSAIKQIVASLDAARCDAMAAAAQRKAKRYDWESVALKFAEHYANALCGQGQDGALHPRQGS